MVHMTDPGFNESLYSRCLLRDEFHHAGKNVVDLELINQLCGYFKAAAIRLHCAELNNVVTRRNPDFMIKALDEILDEKESL